MKVTAQFNDRPPTTIEGPWRLTIEIDGQSFTLIPQMVDKGEPKMLLTANDLGSSLVIIPHGSNSIRFGAK